MKKAGIEIPKSGIKPKQPEVKQEVFKGGVEEKWRPMVIDLESQVADSLQLRIWNYLKYFFSHIFIDKCSIILILVLLALIAATAICFILPFKSSHPKAPYKVL